MMYFWFPYTAWAKSQMNDWRSRGMMCRLERRDIGCAVFFALAPQD